MRDDIAFIRVSSRYKTDFNQQEFALSGAISVEPKPPCLSRVDCSLHLAIQTGH